MIALSRLLAILASWPITPTKRIRGKLADRGKIAMFLGYPDMSIACGI
jgi:hypothetical protein